MDWIIEDCSHEGVKVQILKVPYEFVRGGNEMMKITREKKMGSNKQRAIKKLQTLRNIGSITAERLYSIGIKTPERMKQTNPEKLYEKLNKRCGGKLDRCVLYQFRGAIMDLPWPKCKNLKK